MHNYAEAFFKPEREVGGGDPCRVGGRAVEDAGVLRAHAQQDELGHKLQKTENKIIKTCFYFIDAICLFAKLYFAKLYVFSAEMPAALRQKSADGGNSIRLSLFFLPVSRGGDLPHPLSGWETGRGWHTNWGLIRRPHPPAPPQRKERKKEAHDTSSTSPPPTIKSRK